MDSGVRLVMSFVYCPHCCHTSKNLYKRMLEHPASPWEHSRVKSHAMLRALAEPKRQEILRLVRDRPHSAGEIGEHFDISQQAVSQHLQVLAGAGLVGVRRDGKRRLYVVNPDGLAVLERFLSELWPASLRRLKKAVESNRGK